MAFQRVARVNEVPVGRLKSVRVGDEDVVLCNVNGTIYAIANVCTHDGGPLEEGCLLGDQVECPRHGARFDVRTGAVRALPAVFGIPVFAVKLVGEDVLVDVD